MLCIIIEQDVSLIIKKLTCNRRVNGQRLPMCSFRKHAGNLPSHMQLPILINRPNAGLTSGDILQMTSSRRFYTYPFFTVHFICMYSKAPIGTTVPSDCPYTSEWATANTSERLVTINIFPRGALE